MKRLSTVLFTIAFIFLLIESAIAVTVNVEPANQQIQLAETGVVKISIKGVANLGAFEFKLHYNGSILHVAQDEDVQLGSFIKSTGRTVNQAGPNIDNDAGVLSFGAYTFGSDLGTDGNGLLATITFTAQEQGVSVLSLANVQVADINGKAISVDTHGGQIAVGSMPKAVVNIAPAQNQITFPSTVTVNINVNIENVTDLGAFEFKLLYNSDVVKVLELDNVQLGDFIKNTDRTVAKVGPNIDDDGGILSFGGYTFGDKPGPDGDGVLAVITFTAQNMGVSDLDLTDIQVTDTNGDALFIETHDGQIVVDSPPPTIVKVAPASQQIGLPGAATVNINIENVTNLGAFEFRLLYNSDVAKVLQVDDVQLGDFIESTARTAAEIGPNIDNDAGILSFGAYTYGANLGPDGDGLLATITFTAENEGATLLDLDAVQAANINGDGISADVIDGQLSVVSILDALTISPDTATIAVGQIQQFSVSGEDSGGNPVSVKGVLWEVVGDIGEITNAGLFTTTKDGTGTIKATVGSVFDETGTITVTLPPTAKVSINPSPKTINLGETALIDVKIDDAVNLGAFEFVLQCNPPNIVSADDVQLGGFLGSTGRNTAAVPITIDNENGSLSFGAYSFGTTNGPNGYGILAQITFTAQNEGTTNLDFTMMQVTDTKGKVADVDVSGGVIIVEPSSPGPWIQLNLTEGVVGTSVHVTGGNFDANETVSMDFGDSSNYKQCQTDANGNFACDMVVPKHPFGDVMVIAKTSTKEASKIFKVDSQISVNPKSGTCGETVRVSGSGFGASESVTVHLGSQTEDVQTTALGSFTVDIVLGEQPFGPKDVKAISPASGASKTLAGGFSVKAKISLSVAQAQCGENIVVSGCGFKQDSKVNIYIGEELVGDKIPSDSKGSFEATVKVPQGIYGKTKLKVEDVSGTPSVESDIEISDTKPPEITDALADPPHIIADGKDTSLLKANITDSCTGVDSVIINLSLIGGIPTQPMYDDGTHGDKIAGDSVYSYETKAAVGISDCDKPLKITATDFNGKSASADIILKVDSAKPSIEEPNATPPGIIPDGEDTSLLTVKVTDMPPDCGTGIESVIINLSDIGGEQEQPMYDDGTNGDKTPNDNVYSFLTTAEKGTGTYHLSATATDVAGNVSVSSISLCVDGTEPEVTGGNAEPPVVPIDGNFEVILTVSVGDAGCGLDEVTVNLSRIRLNSEQPMYDDGTNGDATAGDGVYSYKFEVPRGTNNGTYWLPVTAIDVAGNEYTTIDGVDSIEFKYICTEPVAIITSPEANACLRRTISIIGATDGGCDGLQSWVLHGIPGCPPDGQASTIKIGNEPVLNAELASWDTTKVADDDYTLKLTVTDKKENTREFTVCVTVDNTEPFGDDPDPDGQYIELTSSYNNCTSDKYIRSGADIIVSGVTEPRISEIVSARLLWCDSPIPIKDVKDDIHIDENGNISGQFKVDDLTNVTDLKLELCVKDCAGNAGCGESNCLIVDDDLPSGKIENPADYAYFGYVPINISGEACDELSGVAKVELDIGDGWFTVFQEKRPAGCVKWGPYHFYPPGPNVQYAVKIRITDNACNTYEPPKVIHTNFFPDLPTVNISAPIDDSEVSCFVDITGSVLDTDQNYSDFWWELYIAPGENAPRRKCPLRWKQDNRRQLSCG